MENFDNTTPDTFPDTFSYQSVTQIDLNPILNQPWTIINDPLLPAEDLSKIPNDFSYGVFDQNPNQIVESNETTTFGALYESAYYHISDKDKVTDLVDYGPFGYYEIEPPKVESLSTIPKSSSDISRSTASNVKYPIFHTEILLDFV